MAQVLEHFSEALAAAVAEASPSVVRVEARRRLPASGIVWSSDGVVVTAHHVVEQDEEIKIGLPDGATVPATLIGRDPSTDLAALRLQATGLKPPSWAEPEALQVGHLVLAVGRPGRSVRATLGIVSAKGGTWRTSAGGAVDTYLQSDLTMYPGFSGGPLLEVSGRAVGLNTSALARGSTVALPAPTLRQIMQSLLAHGRVRRGYLGVSAQPARLPAGLAQQLGQETGLLVANVEAGSPAERAGVLLGDTIVALDGQPMRHLDDLQAFLGGDRVGVAVTARMIRGGQVQERTVTIGERP